MLLGRAPTRDDQKCVRVCLGCGRTGEAFTTAHNCQSIRHERSGEIDKLQVLRCARKERRKHKFWRVCAFFTVSCGCGMSTDIRPCSCSCAVCSCTTNSEIAKEIVLTAINCGVLSANVWRAKMCIGIALMVSAKVQFDRQENKKGHKNTSVGEAIPTLVRLACVGMDAAFTHQDLR